MTLLESNEYGSVLFFDFSEKGKMKTLSVSSKEKVDFSKNDTVRSIADQKSCQSDVCSHLQIHLKCLWCFLSKKVPGHSILEAANRTISTRNRVLGEAKHFQRYLLNQKSY